MNKKMKKDVKLSPSAIIAVGFLLLILTATLLLMLPISARNRQSTPLLTSLFTATSAVCVTGQALVDTGTHWSLFGQVVLIVAIQIGGLGVMTLMALVSMALGKRIGLRQRTLLQESVASFQVGGIVRLVRFAMRGTAVVEGCGDHALEYMTGGCVVILGRTGRNVAAGMSGGVAYILDEDHDLYLRVNRDLVEIEDVDDPRDIARLKEILTDYVRVTHSEKGSEVLEQFMEKLPLFRKIIPHDYRVMTENIERFTHDGCDEEEAQRRAFAQMYES